MNERTSRRTPARVSTNEPAAQQHDVLARHRENVQQTAAAHVVDGAGGHGLLVAQDHRLEHLANRRAQAAADVAAGGEAQAVDQTAQTASPPGQAQRGQRRGEHDVLAAPLQVAPVVEGAGLGHRQGLDLRRRQPQARALDQRPERGEGRRGSRAEIEREGRSLGDGRTVDRGDQDVERHPVAADLGQRQRVCPQSHRVSDEARQSAV